MPIFKFSGDGSFEENLIKIKAIDIDTEKILQKTIEKNLMEVLGMYFLKSEYTTTSGGRIDTIAVDTDGAPVIIEYKKNKNINVINQALSYLKWLKNQKQGFFEKLISDEIKQGGEDLIKRLDWKNPRVICVAEAYSHHDMDTVEFLTVRMELYRYKFYEGGVLKLELESDPSTSVFKESSRYKVKTYTQDGLSADLDPSIELLKKNKSKKICDLFEQLREKVRDMDSSIQEKVTNKYVAFRLSKNFAEVHINKNEITIHLRPKNYKTTKVEVKQVPETHKWTLDRKINLKDSKELDEVIDIVKQSYEDVL